MRHVANIMEERLFDLAGMADLVFWPVALDFKRQAFRELPAGSVDIGLFNGAVRTSARMPNRPTSAAVRAGSSRAADASSSARKYIQLPALTARAGPITRWSAGCPRRVSELSSKSSITSDPACSISTASTTSAGAALRPPAKA